MKLLFILPLTFLMSSCLITRSKSKTAAFMDHSTIEIQMSQIDETLYQQDTAPLQIDSISVNEGILTVKFNCAFNPGKLQLVGSPMLAKSFPPIRNCKFVVLEQLAGKKDKDQNKNYQGELYIDLKPLAHKFVKDAPTYLQIEGWPDKILFIYPE